MKDVVPGEPAAHLATGSFLLTSYHTGLTAGSQAHLCPRYWQLAAASVQPKGRVAAQEHRQCTSCTDRQILGKASSQVQRTCKACRARSSSPAVSSTALFFFEAACAAAEAPALRLLIFCSHGKWKCSIVRINETLRSKLLTPALLRSHTIVTEASLCSLYVPVLVAARAE